jgi:hypothetical protein
MVPIDSTVLCSMSMTIPSARVVWWWYMPFVVVDDEDKQSLLVGRSVGGPLQIMTAPRMPNLCRFIGLALLGIQTMSFWRKTHCHLTTQWDVLVALDHSAAARNKRQLLHGLTSKQACGTSEGLWCGTTCHSQGTAWETCGWLTWRLLLVDGLLGFEVSKQLIWVLLVKCAWQACLFQKQ